MRAAEEATQEGGMMLSIADVLREAERTTTHDAAPASVRFDASWPQPDYTVHVYGSPSEAARGGEVAVDRYRRALKRLADS
jgi:hypothetical protein